MTVATVYKQGWTLDEVHWDWFDPSRVDPRLLAAVNKGGEIFMSHTRLNHKFVIRLAVGNLHTTEVHVGRAWELIRQHAADLNFS